MVDESLVKNDLTGSILVMKKFNARRRLRAAADAIITLNRMKGGALKSKKGKFSNHVYTYCHLIKNGYGVSYYNSNKNVT